MKKHPWHLLLLLTSLLAPDRLHAQETIIRGFTDVTYSVLTEDGFNPSFKLGEYALYAASDLSDRVSFLGETTFKYAGDFKVGVERVVIRYSVNDRINLEVGKHHTPIGYWNTAYHHGRVLQPTITRPLMLSFEKNGGIMPIHNIGFMAWGHAGSGVHYEALLADGIGSSPSGDNDKRKAVALALHKEVVPGLRLGVTSYFDQVAAGVPSLQRNDSGRIPLAETMDQRILGGNVHFHRKDLEALFEVLTVQNTTASVQAQTLAYYGYAGYSVASTTAYTRFDALQYQDQDPYFIPEDVHQVLLGLEYNLNFLAVARVEYQVVNRATTQNRFLFQFALGF